MTEPTGESPPETTAEEVDPVPSPSKPKPKLRIRLSLKLPTQANSGKKVKPLPDEDETGADNATETKSEPASSAGKEKARAKYPKRRATNPSRPIKIPPIHSPGMLMKPPNVGSIPKTSYSLDKKGRTTPAEVFFQTMRVAGYTEENRSQHPHRGSSVQRQVGDMFDSNVGLALHFPDLIPPDLEPEDDNLRESLLQGLVDGQDDPMDVDTENGQAKPWSFKDMIPVSLTTEYPETYLERRSEYAMNVEEREKEIAAFQEAEEKYEVDPTAAAPTMDSIPPIPEPPEPPRLAETNTCLKRAYDSSTHPNYLVGGKARFVSHMDNDAFHFTRGRYFGLYSNEMADPNFVGANAAGISGASASGGAGLATATTSNVGVTAFTLTSSSFKPEVDYEAQVGQTIAAAPENVTSESLVVEHISITKEGNGQRSKLKPTKSLGDLKKLMDGDELFAAKTRKIIIRAAVYDSRTEENGSSFRGPDEEVYPDSSKAFALYAGIKPCERCKNNKQGAFHCRVRRKHRDEDYDGSRTSDILPPLFAEPLESLLV